MYYFVYAYFIAGKYACLETFFFFGYTHIYTYILPYICFYIALT